MKTIKPKAITQCAVCALFIVLSSCSSKPNKAGFWIDDKIDPDIRSTRHQQTTAFLSNVKNGYTKDVHTDLSGELLDNERQTVRSIDHIRNALNKGDYALFKEVYVINKWKSVDTVALNDGNAKVMLTYPGTAKEMYFVMLLPKAGDNKKMITLTYAKLDYGWKITKIEVEPYTVNGKTTPELYKMAYDAEMNKYYEDAVMTAGMGIACAKPNEEWNYAGSEAMLAYSDSIETQEKKHVKFPLKTVAAGSPVSIFKVYDQKNDDGIFPTICYVTKVNLKNPVAVQQENLKIQKVIGTLIPGLDKNKKFLLYSAYNKEPIDAYQNHFDMTQKLQ